MKAIVVGAGISGLTVALSLQSHGIDVDVFESVDEIRPLGLGINLQPYAIRELFDLGFEELLRRRGAENRTLLYFNRFGQEVWADQLGMNAGYCWPQLAISRGVLQESLLNALCHRGSRHRVHAGHRFTNFSSGPCGVEAEFVTSKGETKTVSGDLLIGADGVKSAVRVAMFGPEQAPRYSGLTLWRGIASADKILDGESMFVAGNHFQRLVCYPIGSSNKEQIYNWVGVLEEGDEVPPEEWNALGNRELFLSRFSGWKFDWLDIPAFLSKAEKILRFPMVDRDPLKHWYKDNVVLIGDAAHPIYPVGSNGASHAIVDARVLAHSLGNYPSIASALQNYEKNRLPMLIRTLEANRLGGPDRILSEADRIAPNGFTDIDSQFPSDERRGIIDAYRTLAGFPPNILNQHPGHSPSALRNI